MNTGRQTPVLTHGHTMTNKSTAWPAWMTDPLTDGPTDPIDMQAVQKEYICRPRRSHESTQDTSTRTTHCSRALVQTYQRRQEFPCVLRRQPNKMSYAANIARATGWVRANHDGGRRRIMAGAVRLRLTRVERQVRRVLL